MKRNIVVIAIMSTLITGCSVSFKNPSANIEPISNISELNNVCIYQDVSTISSYDKAGEIISNKLNTLNISNKLVNKENLNDCTYTLSYTILKAINIPTYLSYMYVDVLNTNEERVGSIKYNNRSNGSLFTLSSASFTDTDEKINEFLDKLLSVNLDKDN
ncbi:hypothetical protein GYM75_02670 [Gilliamella sp. ESL0441]|uniref:hypothetical protein n=1 Tax=Gilliamella sp. ESL0441 TaxID=2704654 RepID=UPI001C69C975|nr:hypothetical protein [Gilliamella sp. ESL0441]QYN43821.1 hypothetical protein GYM75_02670 [Gilliamella sp. ESL0441]